MSSSEVPNFNYIWGSLTKILKQSPVQNFMGLCPVEAVLTRGQTRQKGAFYDYAMCLRTAFLHYKINPLNPELNPICHLLALLGVHFLHVSRTRVKSLTLRLLMSYINGAPILDSF
jgi:hypothetical protein